MQDLCYEDFFEGMNDTLHKAANEHLFTSPNNASLFPNLTSQAKWKFAKGPNFLRLHDGQKVYGFDLPGGFAHDEEFAATRAEDSDPSKFEEGATGKGLAQVHRADPGSIYFTLQEGKDNPTYTFKHTGESNWRGVPKKRRAKEVVVPVDMSSVTAGVKAAFAAASLAPKEASNPFNWAAGPGAQALQRGLMAPGEMAFRFADRGENPLTGALATAGVGAGLGAAYHLGKRHLYNTADENAAEDEEGLKPLLRRMAIPAAGLGVLGGVQASMFTPQYQDVVSGAGMRSKVW